MALVNTYPYTLLTRGLLTHFKKRREKSLILTICSTISFGPSSYDALYACTKVFEEFTVKTLSAELGEVSRVDFLTMHPQYVSTNNARLPAGGLVDTPEAFVNATIKEVGIERYREKCGTWKHNISGAVIKSLHSLLGRWNLQQAIIERVIRGKAEKMWAKR